MCRSGIGRSIAISFAQEGCQRISICDRNESGLKETLDLIQKVAENTQVLLCVIDVAEAKQPDFMVSNTVDKFGRLDYGVNAAGKNFRFLKYFMYK